MSEGERRLADTRGRFLQVVKNGRKLDDVTWTNGRILLSNRRLVLVASAGKRTIPLSKIQDLGGRYDVNQSVARVAGYVSLQFDDNVVLIAAKESNAFEIDLFAALLDRTAFLVRHPAVKGGVVQDSEWEKARVKVGDDAVNVATTSGAFVEIELDDIGSVGVGDRTVRDKPRSVIEVEHTVDGTSLESHFAGADRDSSFLKTLFQKGERQSHAELDLNQSEKEVLMALYSGVSSFEIPNFTGRDVDDIEETFERLVELEVLDEVRTRREVALTTRGRNIASEAINDQ